MSSISTLEVAWEHFPWDAYDRGVEEEMDETYFCWKVAETNKLELLKWAREEKRCEWDEGTIDAAAEQGNLEMVKYCLQISVLSMRERVDGLPQKVISSASNTYAKKSKRPGILGLPLGRLQKVISTYSNILLSVSMINITYWRVILRPSMATWTV